MANYSTPTSDKSKKKAMKLLLCGGIGLHLFYVGRIKAAIARLVIGLLLWGLLITCIIEGETEIVILSIILIILLNVFDLVKLALGTFKDNVGNNLRA